MQRKTLPHARCPICCSLTKRPFYWGHRAYYWPFSCPPYIRCTHHCERHWLQFNSKKQNMSNWCSPFGQKPIFAETSFERLPSIGIPTEGSFSRSISIARMVKNEQEREKVRERGERERDGRKWGQRWERADIKKLEEEGSVFASYRPPRTSKDRPD